jgi:hypothetical protein
MSTPRSHIEEVEVQLLSFLTLALDGGQLTSSPGHITPEKEEWYPLNRRVSGPQRRSGRFGEEENNLPLRGFEPRTLRSVA